jgi:hypothetical protein
VPLYFCRLLLCGLQESAISEIILDNKESISDFADAGRKVLGKYMLMQLLPEAINRTDYKSLLAPRKIQRIVNVSKSFSKSLSYS